MDRFVYGCILVFRCLLASRTDIMLDEGDFSFIVRENFGAQLPKVEASSFLIIGSTINWEYMCMTLVSCS